MPGLLGDALPWAYSQGDRAKRYLNGLLNDPLGTAQQAVGQFGDNTNALSRLAQEAYADPKSYQPTDPKAMNRLADLLLTGPLGFAPVGMTAWHGSPHTFDKFDASKIGSGEGNQSYGHGLYLAENPAVASEYKEAGAMVSPRLRMILDNHGGDLQRTLATLKTKDPYGVLPEAQAMRQGHLYKVDLPDSAAARMLDWDKPLSQQHPDTRKAIQQTDWYQRAAQLATGPDARLFVHPDQRTGAEAYRMMTDADKQSADILRQQGIPGIRYLDQASRSSGGGTSNFVVFPGEENMLSILARNGQPVR